MRDLILGYFSTKNLGDQIMLQEVINSLPEQDEVFYMWGDGLMFNPRRAKHVGSPQPPYDRVIFTVGGFWSYKDVRGKLGNATLIAVGVTNRPLLPIFPFLPRLPHELRVLRRGSNRVSSPQKLCRMCHQLGVFHRPHQVCGTPTRPARGAARTAFPFYRLI